MWDVKESAAVISFKLEAGTNQFRFDPDDDYVITREVKIYRYLVHLFRLSKSNQ